MWWSSAWERKTEIGLPSAAHTLLKFTPAAITRTITSNAAGCGTAISSSWKASVGSPSRSARMTQAAIVGGSSPGSTSSMAIWLVSTDMDKPYAVSEPVVALDPEECEQHHSRDHERADAIDQEIVPGVDVADEPAEVLAEEAGHDGPDDEDRAADRQPRGDRVEAVGVRVEVGLREREQVVELALELAGDLRQVVADVTQVGPRALGQPLQAEDHLVRGLELLVLGGGDPVQLADVLLEPVAAREVLPARPGQDLDLKRVDVVLDRGDHGIERVGEPVKDAVDDDLLVMCGLFGERCMEVDQRRAGVLVDGGDEVARDVDVHLERLGRHARGEEDEQDMLRIRL